MCAVKLRDAVRDEPVVVQLQVAAHAIELQHRGDAVGFFETHVGNIFQYGFTFCERTQRRQDGQHVWNVAAVDSNSAQLDTGVPYADGVRLRVIRHWESHLPKDLHKRTLGMVRKFSRQRLQTAEEHVRGMKGRRGEPKRGRADVGRKLERRRTRPLSGFDLEAPPIRRDLYPQIEATHHLGR